MLYGHFIFGAWALAFAFISPLFTFFIEKDSIRSSGGRFGAFGSSSCCEGSFVSGPSSSFHHFSGAVPHQVLDTLQAGTIHLSFGGNGWGGYLGWRLLRIEDTTLTRALAFFPIAILDRTRAFTAAAAHCGILNIALIWFRQSISHTI